MSGRRSMVALVVLAVAVAACGGSGPSQAEYDQRLAELTLTQQELADTRDQLAATEGALEAVEAASAEPSRLLEEVEGRVLEALGLTGMSVDRGQDRVEVLAAAVQATVEERNELLMLLEGGPPEGGGPTLRDTDQLDALLEISAAVLDITRPEAERFDVELIEDLLGPPIDRAGDEMVSLAYEAMLEGWSGASDDERIELLTNVGWWATDIARSLVAGA